MRLGNGQIENIKDLQAEVVYYTSLLALFVNMVSMGSLGRVEQRMNEAGGDLKEIKVAVHSITAHLLVESNQEDSVFTAYSDDDLDIWRVFRRDLRHDGFSSSVIQKHEATIRQYIAELGDRGLFDDCVSTRTTESVAESIACTTSNTEGSGLASGWIEPVQEGSVSPDDSYESESSDSDESSTSRASTFDKGLEKDLPTETSTTMQSHGARFNSKLFMFCRRQKRPQSSDVSKRIMAPDWEDETKDENKEHLEGLKVCSIHPRVTFREAFSRVAIVPWEFGIALLLDSPSHQNSPVDKGSRRGRWKGVRVNLCKTGIFKVDRFVRERGHMIKSLIGARDSRENFRLCVQYAVEDAVFAFAGIPMSGTQTKGLHYRMRIDTKACWLSTGYGFSPWQEPQLLSAESQGPSQQTVPCATSIAKRMRNQAFRELSVIFAQLHRNLKPRLRDSLIRDYQNRRTTQMMIHDVEEDVIAKLDMVELDPDEEDHRILLRAKSVMRERANSMLDYLENVMISLEERRVSDEQKTGHFPRPIVGLFRYF